MVDDTIDVTSREENGDGFTPFGLKLSNYAGHEGFNGLASKIVEACGAKGAKALLKVMKS